MKFAQIVFAGIFASSAFWPVSSTAEIAVGVAGPMTGPNSVFGIQMLHGAEQAITDINAAGGILGQKLVASVKDDRSDPAEGIAIANQFSKEGVKWVVGHFNSGVSIPVSEVYAAKGILEITPASTNPLYTDRKLWNVFRTSSRDDRQGPVAGSYISKNFSGKTIALLSDGSRYGNGLVLGTKKSMKGKYAKVMTIALAQNQSDFSRLVSQLKKSKVDFVFWGGLAKQLGLIVRRMREEGVEATVMGADGIADFEYSTFGGPGVTGTLMTFAADPQKRPEAAAVVKNMTANGFRPEAYTLYAYASVEVLKQAAEKAKSLDPKIISKMIKTGMEFNTVLGKFTYNKKGDRENDDYAIYVWRKIDGRMGYVEK